MKYIILLLPVFLGAITKGQSIPNMPIDKPAIGIGADYDQFTYDNKKVGHYSIGWYSDSWTGAGAYNVYRRI